MKYLQHPRGTTAQNDDFVGLEAQLTADTERWELRLHDDETPGGHRILNLEQLLEIFMHKDSEFGAVAFAPNDRGFLVRVGHKVWTLREFEAGDGIEITNPVGQEGNPVISLDTDFLDDLFLQKEAGRLLARTTTGDFLVLEGDIVTTTVKDFEVTTPADDEETEDKVEGWIHNVDGACIVLKFHENAVDEATLSVNEATAIPLKSANGSTKTSAIARKNTVALAVYFGGSYYLIGLQHPQEQGIIPITGLTATNVQDALEELAGDDEVSTGSGLDGYYVFGAMNVIAADFELSDILTASGKCMLMYRAGAASSTNGENTTPGNLGTLYYVVRLENVYWAGIIPMWPFTWTMANGSLIVTDIQSGVYNPAAMYGPPAQFIQVPNDGSGMGTIFSNGWSSFQRTAAKP